MVTKKLWIIVVIIILFGWLFNAYSSKSSSPVMPSTSYEGDTYYDEDEEVVEDPKYESPGLEYRGYPCTEDCSGHEAGYEWAEENGIESIDDCGGNSNSFVEGCYSYVEENYPEEGEHYDDYGYEDY